MNYAPSYESEREKLIVALDVATGAEALAAMNELKDEVGAFKIGLQLFTSEGPSLVRKAVSSGARIFLDVKYHDIPNTVAKAAVEAASLGVWMFNMHASGGSEMMKSATGEVRDFCARRDIAVPKMIAVTVLTSFDRAALEETGVGGEVEDRVLRLTRLAAKCGMGGVVASANEAALINRILDRPDFDIVTPGIRPLNATSDDQKRVTTPGDAVRAGSDFLVVGRPIMDAADRPEAARKIVREMTDAGTSSRESADN